MDANPFMIRRLGLAAALAVLGLVVVVVAIAGAGEQRHVIGVTTTTTTAESTSPTSRGLPGTTVEAEQRDDGTTRTTWWLVGSGLLAAGSIAVGGTILQRHSRRHEPL